MGVLWFILRLLLWLLCAVLVLAALALFLPVGVQVTYEKGGLTVDARAAFVKLRVFPFPKRRRAARKKADKKPRPKKEKPAPAAPAEAPSGAPEQAAPPKKPAVRLPFRPQITLATIRALAQAATGMLRRVLRGIRVHAICLRWPVHGPDAAETALQYGRANALLHSTLAAVSNLMRLEIREITLTPDFTGEAKGSEYFSCKITTRLFIMVTAGIWALYKIWRAGFFGPVPKEEPAAEQQPDEAAPKAG